MRKYSKRISLEKNKRGVWSLDPFKGCNHNCYGICYAAKIAKFRGYDFNSVEQRDFRDRKQFLNIVNKIRNIPFIRMGVSCDPSYDWEHTLKIVEKIRPYNQNIVIITKHWNELTRQQCEKLKGICINTSISAMDSDDERVRRLYWYNELKKYCKSVLRVNTANFNDEKLKNIQNELLKNENVIDNVLRFEKKDNLVKNGIVNIKRYNFLNTKTLMSKHDDSIFTSYCRDCNDQCGIGKENIQMAKYKSFKQTKFITHDFW